MEVEASAVVAEARPAAGFFDARANTNRDDRPKLGCILTLFLVDGPRSAAPLRRSPAKARANMAGPPLEWPAADGPSAPR